MRVWLFPPSHSSSLPPHVSQDVSSASLAPFQPESTSGSSSHPLSLELLWAVAFHSGLGCLSLFRATQRASPLGSGHATCLLSPQQQPRAALHGLWVHLFSRASVLWKGSQWPCPHLITVWACFTQHLCPRPEGNGKPGPNLSSGLGCRS